MSERSESKWPVRSEKSAIFIYRDERRLFAVITLIIAVSLIALLQIGASRSGAASPISAAGTSVAWGFQEGGSAVAGAIRGAVQGALDLPSIERKSAELQRRNAELQTQNTRLQEQLAAYRSQLAIAPQMRSYPRSIQARVIGFPPEGGIQSVTIDKGLRDGVRRDDGVLDATGVVGKIVEAGPIESKAELITDFTSTIPAIVARTRSWGIARGNQTSLRLEYVSQDSPLRAGDVIVTGEARSFHSGAPLGSVVRVDRSDDGLYQTAVVKPAANLGSLDRVIVVSK